MTTTVVNLRGGPYDVYIGRGSKWGNPYTYLPLASTKAVLQVATRDEAIKKYREYLLSSPELLAHLNELRGKVLGCYCKPAACHGDVLAELADRGTT